jgi:hypothetical protein
MTVSPSWTPSIRVKDKRPQQPSSRPPSASTPAWGRAFSPFTTTKLHAGLESPSARWPRRASSNAGSPVNTRYTTHIILYCILLAGGWPRGFIPALPISSSASTHIEGAQLIHRGVSYSKPASSNANHLPFEGARMPLSPHPAQNIYSHRRNSPPAFSAREQQCQAFSRSKAHACRLSCSDYLFAGSPAGLPAALLLVSSNRLLFQGSSMPFEGARMPALLLRVPLRCPAVFSR